MKKIIIATLVVVIGTGIAFMLPRFKQYRTERARQRCLANLLMINEPLNCCIPMEQGLKLGTPIDRKLLPQYLLHGVVPRCPSGAEYSIPFVVGDHPTCPTHGDLLAGVKNLKKLPPEPIAPLTNTVSAASPK